MTRQACAPGMLLLFVAAACGRAHDPPVEPGTEVPAVQRVRLPRPEPDPADAQLDAGIDATLPELEPAVQDLPGAQRGPAEAPMRSDPEPASRPVRTIPVGGKCADSVECRYGLRCVHKACVPGAPRGARCKFSEDCGFGLMCAAKACIPAPPPP